MNERAKARSFKTAKRFKNGSNHAVHVPAEFRFKGNEVDIRRDEKARDVISGQTRTDTWDEFFRLRALIPREELESLMEDREQGEQTRDDPFLA